MFSTRNICLSIAACAAATVMMASAAPTWRTQVDGLISKGEFAQAQKIMNSLPKSVRTERAVEIDSLSTIMERIRSDFTITPDEGRRLIREKMPEATEQQIEAWKRNKQIEFMVIDGREWWFRKAIRNLWLLAPELREDQKSELHKTFVTRRGYVVDALKSAPDKNGVRDWRKTTITFTLDVKADAVPAGETLRVWMPFPFENVRQRNIKMLSANRPVTFSSGSKHHTVYMEATATAGKPTHFEYTFSYEMGERHIAQQDIVAMCEPYDTSSELYRTFTASQPPHIIITPQTIELAKQIVGEETSPVLQCSKIFNWISLNFPWAGAREYSTLSNIPQYVLENRHGDCGQVALLYITLARSLGVPTRWESGYMLHPGEVNYHDWAETYFEGVGWVHTDPSFGRSAVGTSIGPYYATGIDVYRLATNEAVGDKLSPEKRFIRSETVDFQPGEVEWRGGNLYYDKWNSHLEVNSIEKIK